MCKTRAPFKEGLKPTKTYDPGDRKSNFVLAKTRQSVFLVFLRSPKKLSSIAEKNPAFDLIACFA